MQTDADVGSRTPSRTFAFFFETPASVAVLVVLGLAATTFVPDVGALVPMLIGLLALLLGWKGGSVAQLGLERPASWPRTILLGAAIGVSLQMSFNILLDPLFEMLSGTHIEISNVEAMEGDPLRYIIWLLIGWVIGGFLEELSFRGYVISRIQSLLGSGAAGTTIAVIASAVPFGVAHMWQDTAGALSAGFMGLVFAVVYVRSGRALWLTMLVHGFANSTDITLIFLGLGDTFRLF